MDPTLLIKCILHLITSGGFRGKEEAWGLRAPVLTVNDIHQTTVVVCYCVVLTDK